MKLAYSTSAYRCFGLGDAVDHVAELGYRGIEIMADLPHAWPATTPADDVASIRARVEAAGLTICNVNACTMNGLGDFWHPSWIESDGAYRRKRIQHTVAALRLAAALGAKSLTTQPGGPMEPDMAYERALDSFAAGLREVVSVADDLGLRLLVQPQPWQLIQTTDQYLNLAERVGSWALGLDLDIGSLHCMAEPVADTVRRVSESIQHYHIEDMAADRTYEPLVPGRGVIDFTKVWQAIAATGYDGWITVQLYPYIDDPDAAGAEAKVRLEWLANRVASSE